jgi:histidinol-phosphatase (PHP family)
MEDYCKAALEKGFKALGFSDHAPIYKKTGIRSSWNMAEERLGDYLREAAALKKRWEGKLEIYTGLEVDFFEGQMGPADSDYAELKQQGLLDYILGSVHFVHPHLEVDNRADAVKEGIEKYFQGKGEAVAALYWEKVLKMLQAGGMDLVGHLDLVRKNNGTLHFFDPEGAAYRQGWTAAIAAIPPDALVEINTGGVNRGFLSEPYPAPELIAACKERSLRLIPSSDAHRPEDLDGNYLLAVSAS